MCGDYSFAKLCIILVTWTVSLNIIIGLMYWNCYRIVIGLEVHGHILLLTKVTKIMKFIKVFKVFKNIDLLMQKLTANFFLSVGNCEEVCCIAKKYVLKITSIS